MNGKINIKKREKLWGKFKGWCHQAVIEGYQNMIIIPMNYAEWEEENLSASLLYEMEKLLIVKKKRITIVRESYLDDKTILTGQKKAKEAERIDFRFSKWVSEDNTFYFGEAKILSHKSWKKKKLNKKGKPTPVKAWNQQDYYIKTGIQGLILGKYKNLQGFLIGYVVNGTPTNIVDALNQKIENRNLLPSIGKIENQETICGHRDCYTSDNQITNNTLTLRHIFLPF